MTEKELQDAVIAYLRMRKWFVAHFHEVPVQRGGTTIWMTPAQADGKGFPDIVAVRERLVTIELKAKGKKPTEEQNEWWLRLNEAGVEQYLWYPEDWKNGTIEDVLR